MKFLDFVIITLALVVSFAGAMAFVTETSLFLGIVEKLFPDNMMGALMLALYVVCVIYTIIRGTYRARQLG